MLDRLKRQKRGDNLPPELLVLGRRDILRIQAPFERTEDFRDPLNVVQGACVQYVADEFGQRDRLDVKLVGKRAETICQLLQIMFERRQHRGGDCFYEASRL